MPTFELVFDARYEDLISSAPAREIRRVVCADNVYWARQIGIAMIGEEIESNEYIVKLVEWRQTNQKIRHSSFSSSTTWQRVIEKIKIIKDDPEILNAIYNANVRSRS